MKLYIFSTRTNYGEFVRVIIAFTIEHAINMKDSKENSIKSLGWEVLPDSEVIVSDNETPRIVFDGGGDL